MAGSKAEKRQKAKKLRPIKVVNAAGEVVAITTHGEVLQTPYNALAAQRTK